MVSSISAALNKFTPGMTFGRFVNKVLYKGVGCGYVEQAGKRRYALTPVLEKLEHKMALNDFEPSTPRNIAYDEFKLLKILLKPIIRNEKGLSKLNLPNKRLRFSPFPAGAIIWNKDSCEPVVTIIKEMRHPTREIFFHRFPFLRKIWRISPY